MGSGIFRELFLPPETSGKRALLPASDLVARWENVGVRYGI